jgi:hypothetical protein
VDVRGVDEVFVEKPDREPPGGAEMVNLFTVRTRPGLAVVP